MDNQYNNVSDGDYECNHKNEDFGLRDSDPIKMYGERKQKRLPKKNARNDVWKVRDEGKKLTYQEQLDAFRREKNINTPPSSSSSNLTKKAITTFLKLYIILLLLSVISSIISSIYDH